MKFGYFDDAAREYVITTPRTPYPWINYLGCEQFFGIISNTAGGYCFYRDARLRRITRYRYNNLPVDNGGELTILKGHTYGDGRRYDYGVSTVYGDGMTYATMQFEGGETYAPRRYSAVL